MIARFTIANVKPRQLAMLMMDQGIDGTVFKSYGVTRAWGMEPGATGETVIGEDLDGLATFKQQLSNILVGQQEEAAYVTFNGKDAILLYAGKKVQNTKGWMEYVQLTALRVERIAA